MADDSSKKYNTVLEIIEKRLIPDQEAKKARGEVFTPLTLVRQMLYGVKKSSVGKGPTPVIWGFDEKTGEFSDDDEKDRLGGIPLEIFRNADTTWLDPANGIGNFPVVAFYMIDYQLGKHGRDTRLKGDKNVTKRRKHIVENMLYMIELNKGNVNTARKVFKLIAPDATSNICCANTLSITDAKLQSIFGTNRFDVVMGNPPFNMDGTHQSGKAIWHYFITGDLRKKKEYAFSGGLQILNPNGILSYVIPQGWRGAAYESTFNKIKEYHIDMVHILNVSNYFTINLPVDCITIENSKRDTNTLMLYEPFGIYDNININNFDIIPNYGWSVFNKWKRSSLSTLTVKSTSTHNFSSNPSIFRNTKSSDFKYSIVKTLNKKGLTIGYSSKMHEDQNKIKVLIACGSYLYPTIDDGKLGVSQNVFYIICDTLEEAHIIKEYLEDPIIQCFVNALKVASYAVSYKLLSYIPDPLHLRKPYHDSLLLTVKDDKLIELFKNEKESSRQSPTKKAKKIKKGGRFQKTRKQRKN